MEKSKNLFGQGWYNTLEDFDGLVVEMNTRASQSPLHSEIEPLIGSFGHYFCNGLFSVGENGFRTRKMNIFCKSFIYRMHKIQELRVSHAVEENKCHLLCGTIILNCRVYMSLYVYC
ncbi:unnamed protein product [Brassica rapa]|uniref:Uncharacterized protein n=1 Tax=Brassica campestris TaxID=3711 RepID=A0A3P6BCN5_BRACM|nr:unnamed protein product [Brassica rapa]VDD02973.1 unnamed protein product [Brassica rapa]